MEPCVAPQSFTQVVKPSPIRPAQWHTVVANQRTLAPHWLQPWLTDKGSLTRALQAYAGDGFNVLMTQQGWQRVFADEAQCLNSRPQSQAVVREVELRNHTQALVCARTVIPLNTYRKHQTIFRGLGNRSIGEWLFTNPVIHRGPIQVHCFNPTTQLWGRRSLFYIDRAPLMVCEIFLPAFTQGLNSCTPSLPNSQR
ncbi:MAG: chorismate--pyruvate lyase family protein [Pontibacterium sp.]